LADDLLSTLCLARECPLLAAPAMNRQMWDHPATQRNIAQLRGDGVQILGPDAGDQACGEVGMGRMLEPAALVHSVHAAFVAKRLTGKRVLITAGPTYEAIDPVRGITNSSSGRMGYALAQAATDAGAEVTLVSGPTSVPVPIVTRLLRVVSAAEMFAAVSSEVADADIFISVAAVADYAPRIPQAHKIKKSAAPLSLELTPTQDILGYVAKLPDPPFCVGFAAESERLHEQAEAKRKKKRLPLLVGNLVQEVMGQDRASVVLFDESGAHPLARGPKHQVAGAIVEHVAKLYERVERSLPRSPARVG
jgi:phosphopantothenoylcysteine decarboxylase/phosphopantothenate--cysteine ligase